MLHVCGKQHNGRIHRGLHYCKQVGTIINADVNGAYNLYNVAAYGSFLSCRKREDTMMQKEEEEEESSGSRVLAGPLMLRWQYHLWHYEAHTHIVYEW